MAWPKGRPRTRKTEVGAAPLRKPMRWTMAAGARWEGADINEEVSEDRLSVPKEMIPEGMTLQWVTDSVFGQPMPQRRAQFERRGWTPVHPQDFDGRFDGKFTPLGATNEINVDGLVLMARPAEFTEKARKRDRMKATEQVRIKEQSLRGGDLPVTLDAGHPSAVRSNMINRTMERVHIPNDSET